MIKVKSFNQKELEITQWIDSKTRRETEIELSFPKSLDFSNDLSSSDFFNKNIEQKKRLFKSKSPSLTLLYAKYLDKKDFSIEQLNTSLNLFAYQYIQKLKDYSNDISKLKEEIKNEFVDEILTEIINILISFRKINLKDEKAISNFQNIDFLLSFETEQFFLKIVSILKKIKDTKSIRENIIKLAEDESYYRVNNKNHSEDGDFHLVKENNEKFVRILNKIEMRKKLIELPLKVSEKFKLSGQKEKYISLSIATGFIMLIMSFILMQVRILGLDSTIQFVVGIAILYVLRDLFRERFKEVIYNGIISRRPKVQSQIFVPQHQNAVGFTKTWFKKDDKTQFNNYQQFKYKDRISIILKEKIKLMDFEHHGFKKMKTNVDINISDIISQIKRDDRKLFIYGEINSEEKQSISSSKVFKLPRQYHFNLKIKEKKIKSKNYFNIKEDVEETEKNYIVTVTREKIINIKEK